MTYAELRRAIESLPLDDDEEVVIEVDVFHLWSGPGSEDELFTIGQVAYFATPRDLSRATLGPEVGEVSRRLGRPLMPWQQMVVDVAFELDEHGRFVYDEIDITVPRQ